MQENKVITFHRLTALASVFFSQHGDYVTYELDLSDDHTDNNPDYAIEFYHGENFLAKRMHNEEVIFDDRGLVIIESDDYPTYFLRPFYEVDTTKLVQSDIPTEEAKALLKVLDESVVGYQGDESYEGNE